MGANQLMTPRPGASVTTHELSPEQLGKRALISVMALAACAELGYSTLNFSGMPVFLAQDHLFRGATSTIGLIMTAYLFAEGLLKSPMGHLSDRFGRKLFIVSAPTICIFTALFTLLVEHMPITLASKAVCFATLRGVDGIGAAMLWPAAFATLGEAVPPEKRASAMSLLNVTYMAGIAAGLFIGGTVNDLFGTKDASFYAASLLFAVAAVVGVILVPGNQALKKLHRHHEGDAHWHDEEHSITLRDFIDCVKKVPHYLLLAFITFLGVGLPMSIIKLFALSEFHLTETQFGTLLLGPTLAMAALSFPMGRIADRLQPVRSMQVGIGICAVGMWIVTLLPYPVPVALAGSAVGTGFLLALPAWLAAVSEIDRRRRGTYLGAVMTAQGIGAIVGTPLGGALYQFHRMAPFIGCALAVTVSFVLSLIIIRHPPSPDGE